MQCSGPSFRLGNLVLRIALKYWQKLYPCFVKLARDERDVMFHGLISAANRE